ncbi:MAG: pilus assembly protein PilP [Gammaproteobacteria bacterium]|nr:pilus assembly protein PilP [Gammaproteobacteria bacterium]
MTQIPQILATPGRLLLIGAAALSLAGCLGGDMHDLRAYVAEVKARPAPEIEPLPEIKHVEGFIYSARDRRDPFSPDMGMGQEKAEEVSGGTGLRPDPNRRKEELEQFPLDTLRMVGTLDQKTQVWALIKSQDGVIHRVQPGNYLGQNHGQISQIGEEKIDLTEIVSDGRGGYQERQASIGLAGGEK